MAIPTNFSPLRLGHSFRMKIPSVTDHADVITLSIAPRDGGVVAC